MFQSMNSPSFVSVLLRFVVTGAVGILTIWGCLGRMVAEKVATALVMPYGLLWLLLLFSAAYAVAARQRLAAVLLLSCWVTSTIVGSGHLHQRLARSLEGPYLEIDPLKLKPFEFVVVLGGGGGLSANGRMQGNHSADRLIVAAQLYHQKLAGKLICTGQRIESMNSTGADPAEVSRTILQDLGVPADAIETVGGRNTAEEMENLGQRFAESDDRVGLVTSAWHLPRAMRLALRNGFEPEPLPCDFRSPPEVQPPTPGQIIEGLIPSGAAAAGNSALMKEILATLAGR